MKIAILGFGREGKSLLKFLKKSPEYERAEIKILDQKNGSGYLKNLDSFDLVFRSPGVPYNLPEIQKAIKNGVRFSSLTKLFFDIVEPILRRGSGQVIGVTGTKGKGTTSTLIYKILKASGKKVFLAGNIGRPALEILLKMDKNSLAILELSSFQLQDLEKSPEIAVITEIFPDHQDVHKNMSEYLDAKANIARHQKKSGVIFYFKNNLLSRGIAKQSPGKKIAVSAPDTLEKNKILAAAVARHLGCPENIIQKIVKNFRGLEHRLELVRSIRIASKSSDKFAVSDRSIDFYNDSASTNPQTTAAAILSFYKDEVTNQPSNQSLILIAGGKDKNLDYKSLAKAMKKSGQVKLVVLIGENKEKIARALRRIKNYELRIKNAADLKSAVELAYKSAISIIHNSYFVILFSPGAASFDMFKDYADRGEKFKALVKKIEQPQH